MTILLTLLERCERSYEHDLLGCLLRLIEGASLNKINPWFLSKYSGLFYGPHSGLLCCHCTGQHLFGDITTRLPDGVLQVLQQMQGSTSERGQLDMEALQQTFKFMVDSLESVEQSGNLWRQGRKRCAGSENNCLSLKCEAVSKEKPCNGLVQREGRRPSLTL